MIEWYQHFRRLGWGRVDAIIEAWAYRGRRLR